MPYPPLKEPEKYAVRTSLLSNHAKTCTIYGTVRMKRLLLVLVPWMAMTAAAWGQTRSAELFFTYFGSIRDHVFRVGDDCYVPSSVLRGIGWQVEEREGTATVRIDERRARVALRRIGDSLMVPMTEVLGAVGLQYKWETTSNTLDVFAPLNSIRYERGRLSVDAGLPIKTTLTVLQNPKRTVIELNGANLLPETKMVLQDGARIGQYKPNVVRVVIDGELPNASLPASAAVTKTFEANLGTPSDPPTGANVSHDEDPPIAGQPVAPIIIQGSPPPQQTFGTAPIVAGPLNAGSDGPTTAVLSLRLSGPLAAAPTFRRPDPNLLEIVLPNTTLQLGDQPASPDMLSVQSVDTRTEGSSAVLSLRLVRPMGLEISMSAGMLQIRLLKPNVGNGRLAGKLVVIDPGHGGHDSGATTPARELMEKNMTLAIGKLTAQKLAEEGAMVIMTRKTDDFISLTERPSIANRNNADFFVSIHINANGLDTSSRGGITFYHLKDPICQVLADCIQSQIKRVSGLPSLGTWSDGKIYHSGFAVLRGAKMPAVLVECGFINNGSDRKRMMTDDFKQAIATGIVNGLKVYLGEK